MIIVLLWIALAIVVGAAASARGRSGFGWFMLAILLSPLIAGFVLVIVPDLKTRALLERMARASAVDDAALRRAAEAPPPNLQGGTDWDAVERTNKSAAVAIGATVVLALVGFAVYAITVRRTTPATEKGDLQHVAEVLPQIPEGFCERPRPVVFPVSKWTPDRTLAAERALVADDQAGKAIDEARSEAVYDHILLLYGTPHCRDAEPLFDSVVRIDAAAHDYLRRTPRIELTLKGWHKGGFDTIAIVDAEIRNKETHAIKDVRYTCHFFGASGTELSVRSGTIFRKLAPLSSGTVRDLNVGFIDPQVTQASCGAEGANWVQ